MTARHYAFRECGRLIILAASRTQGVRRPIRHRVRASLGSPPSRLPCSFAAVGPEIGRCTELAGIPRIGESEIQWRTAQAKTTATMLHWMNTAARWSARRPRPDYREWLGLLAC